MNPLPKCPVCGELLDAAAEHYVTVSVKRPGLEETNEVAHERCALRIFPGLRVFEATVDQATQAT